MAKLLTFIRELFESNLIKFMNWIAQVSDLNGVILSTKLRRGNGSYGKCKCKLRMKPNISSGCESERENVRNFAAVIQKLKVFLCVLIRLLNCFHTTVQPGCTSERAALAAYNQFQHHNVISSLRFAYAIPPRYFMY